MKRRSSSIDRDFLAAMALGPNWREAIQIDDIMNLPDFERQQINVAGPSRAISTRPANTKPKFVLPQTKSDISVMPNRSRSVPRGRRSSRSLDVAVRSRSRPPTRSPSNAQIASAAAQVMAAAVPQLSPVIAAARIAAPMMKAAKKYMMNRGTSPATSILGRVYGNRKWLSSSTGRYQGKFRKPKKTKNPKVETLCLKKGYHITIETTGRVEDQHCAYMLHSTWNAAAYANAIAGSLLRKLFKKAGISLDQGDQEIAGNLAYDARAWLLEYVTYNPITGIPSGPPTYQTVDNDTFDGILNETTKFGVFKQHITDFLTNTSQEEPYSLNLYSKVTSSASSVVPAATINLANEFVTVYSSSTIKIQNRTAGDLAGTDDRYELDRIDNQPVKGYVYEFYGEPRLKYPRTIPNTGVTQLNYQNATGVTLWRSADLPSAYIEPPVPRLWANCYKSNGVILQPGDMKKGYVAVKHSGRLTNLLKKLRAERIINGATVCGVKGKTQVYGFEEKIRTPGSNPITLQYEAELKVGAVTRSGTTAPLQTSYTNVLYENIPPPPPPEGGS